MILIADSGSSKTAWVGLKAGAVVFEKESAGLNPNYSSSEQIHAEMKSIFSSLNSSVSKIYFYGAGCSSEFGKKSISLALTSVFKTDSIEVNSDMYGAGLSFYKKGKYIAAILGTGSNACLMEDDRISISVPSYGYILGDHGSGAVIGKNTLSHFLDRSFTEATQKEFSTWLSLSEDEIVQKVYREPRANRFLASICLFHALHPDNAELRKIRLSTFNNFFLRQLSIIPDANEYEVNLCGSIAFAFRDEIGFVANENNFKTGQIVKSPIAGLTAFHLSESK